MKRFVKQLSIILLIIIPFFSWAQSDAESHRIEVLLRNYGDSIVLRWAPSNPLVWKIANRQGYKVEKWSPASQEYTELAVIRPYSLEEWKSKSDTTDQLVTIAAQMQHGNSASSQHTTPSLHSYLNASREEMGRFSYALLAADLSQKAATGLGLRLKDDALTPILPYRYKVSIAGDPKIPILPGIAEYNPHITYTAQTVKQVRGEAADSTAILRWANAINTQLFTAYWIERKTGRGNYERLQSTPLFISTPDSVYEHSYRDEGLKNDVTYQYRIIGITPFADEGLPSEVIKVTPRDMVPPPAPHHLEISELSSQKVKVEWQAELTDDHNGFAISRSFNREGPFETLNAKPLGKNAKEFVDPEPSPAFAWYRVSARDRNGNISHSLPRVFKIKDDTPPAQPIGLKGIIDSLGVVALSWKTGTEPDLLGYRVYYSNSKSDREFVQVSPEPVQGNIFLHTIPLNTTTKKVYYKIIAVDYNYNPSAYSEILELKRPDYLPPTSPVFKSYEVEDNSIYLTWVPSSSNDVASHQLFRQEQSGEWAMILDKLDAASFRDTTVAKNQSYTYGLKAVDESGLYSPMSPVVSVFTGNKLAMPSISNVKGSFDKNSKALKLTWDCEGNPVKYVIYRSNESGQLSTHATSVEKQFTDYQLYVRENGYIYRVMAKYEDGSVSKMSLPVEVRFE